MFDALLGVSKQDFLAAKVIPANDNDVFNNNKCTFCWGPYDDEHPGVRVLPCNHVFGQPCLLEMINAPNGDRCPICRTTLFRPPAWVTSQRLLENYLTRLALLLFVGYHKILVCWSAVPAWLQYTIYFWMDHDNVYYYTGLLVNHFSSLSARNPDLNLRQARQLYFCCTRMLHHFHSASKGSPMSILLSIVVATAFSVLGVHGRLSNSQDRTIFFFIMLGAVCLTHLVASLSNLYKDAFHQYLLHSEGAFSS